MKYDINRFKNAQNDCYEQVLFEIRNGKKTSHWMWYIFPQIVGLGRNATKYGSSRNFMGSDGMKLCFGSAAEMSIEKALKYRFR